MAVVVCLCLLVCLCSSRATYLFERSSSNCVSLSVLFVSGCLLSQILTTSSLVCTSSPSPTHRSFFCLSTKKILFTSSTKPKISRVSQPQWAWPKLGWLALGPFWIHSETTVFARTVLNVAQRDFNPWFSNPCNLTPPSMVNQPRGELHVCQSGLPRGQILTAARSPPLIHTQIQSVPRYHSLPLELALHLRAQTDCNW